MTKIGKLYICDRCGNTGFAGYVGGSDRSGWINSFGIFEKLEGWEIWEGKTCARIAPKNIIIGSKVFGRMKSNDRT